MNFELSGVNLRGRDSEVIKGEVNYINKKTGYSKVSYHINKYQLNNFNVSKKWTKYLKRANDENCSCIPPFLFGIHV